MTILAGIVLFLLWARAEVPDPLMLTAMACLAVTMVLERAKA
jgi:uncharacterized membrane protein AbrB (regulator of aidB expression)